MDYLCHFMYIRKQSEKAVYYIKNLKMDSKTWQVPNIRSIPCSLLCEGFNFTLPKPSPLTQNSEHQQECKISYRGKVYSLHLTETLKEIHNPRTSPFKTFVLGEKKCRVKIHPTTEAFRELSLLSPPLSPFLPFLFQ